MSEELILLREMYAAFFDQPKKTKEQFDVMDKASKLIVREVLSCETN